MLAILAAALAAAASASLTQAYADLCLAGNPAADEVLRRADRAGWRKEGPGRPSAFDPGSDRFLVTPAGTLRLSTERKAFNDEELQGCAIDTTAAEPGVIAAMAGLLGVPAALSAPNVADFFAIREAAGWRNGARSDRAEVARARATGSYYSFIVSRTPNSATVVGMHFVPLAGGQGAISGGTAARGSRGPRPSE